MNTKFYLPDFIIILLDDNLINYLDYKRFNVASLLGPWIEYLCQFFAESLQRFQSLSQKARPKLPTQVYWAEAVTHCNFDYLDQQAREIFTQCLDATCKLHNDQMRVLKLREFWDRNDDSLVINNQLTKQGVACYWKSLDASFKFNLKKKEDFLSEVDLER